MVRLIIASSMTVVLDRTFSHWNSLTFAHMRWIEYFLIGIVSPTNVLCSIMMRPQFNVHQDADARLVSKAASFIAESKSRAFLPLGVKSGLFPIRPRIIPARIVRLPCPPRTPPPGWQPCPPAKSGSPPWRDHVVTPAIGPTSSAMPIARMVALTKAVGVSWVQPAHVVTPTKAHGAFNSSRPAHVVTPANGATSSVRPSRVVTPVPTQAAYLKQPSLVGTLLKKFESVKSQRSSSTSGDGSAEHAGVYVDTHDDFEFEQEDELYEEDELVEGRYEDHDVLADADLYEEQAYGHEEADVYSEHMYEDDDGHEEADSYSEHAYEDGDGREEVDMYEEHADEDASGREEVDMYEEHAYEADDGHEEAQVQGQKRKLPEDWQWANEDSWGGSSQDVFRRGPAVPTNHDVQPEKRHRHRGTKHRGGSRDQLARCDMAASADFTQLMSRFHANEMISASELETMRWVYGRAKLDEMMQLHRSIMNN